MELMKHSSDYVLDVINFFKSNNLLSNNLGFDIGGLEPTFSPKFEDIMLILNNYNATGIIYTNCTIFSHQISAALENKKVKIITSLDSGSKETYLTIKRRNCFDKVVQNIQKYASIGHVTIKYIVLEENCSQNELDKFVNLVGEISSTDVLISANMRNKQSKKLLESMLYLRNNLRDKKIYYAWNDLTIGISEKKAEEVVAQ